MDRIVKRFVGLTSDFFCITQNIFVSFSKDGPIQQKNLHRLPLPAGIRLHSSRSEIFPGDSNEGSAAYYSDKFHGRSTASGKPYDKNALTAAHRTLPFGTILRVTNLKNRRSVRVTITDRGPFSHRRRIVDLSRKAAQHLDMIRDGVVPVRIEILSMPKRN